MALQTQANEYAVFEKDGYFGIMDRAGQIAVPPVYDQLGWSNNSHTIVNDVIGFRENGLWGIISIKNKVLVEAKYYAIEHFEKDLLKASIKGRFSNHLFYGLLDTSGKTKISFNYFNLSKIGPHLLVSIYDSRQKFGVLDYSGQIIIPTAYQSIRFDNESFYAVHINSELDLYKQTGLLIGQRLDSLNRTANGFVGFRNGYAGFINDDGIVMAEFIHKDVEIVDDAVMPIPFPTWGIYRERELIYEIEADSLSLSENGLWKAYVNGAHHLTSPDSTFQFKASYLMSVSENHYLVKNSGSGEWMAKTKQHETVLQGYDSIFTTRYTLWAQKSGAWELYNRFGKKKNRFSFPSIKQGLDDQFIVKLNNHWGLMDPLGNLITPIKYDRLVIEGDYYKVSYLGKEGIMDHSGRWKVRAEYAQVYVFGGLFVGRKGYSYAYFGKDGLIRKSTLEPISILGEALLITSDSLLGLMDLEGNILVEPEQYKSIEWRDGLYELKSDSGLVLVDIKGREVFGSALGIEDTGGHSEDLFLIKKNGRWGYFDYEARLRIGNRYDSVQLFSEGYAPVKVNGRWGFIDKEERLGIQPYYDEVTAFENGLSIVRINEKYGIIDQSGQEIVKISWKNITTLPTENYLFVDDDGKVGLISKSGKILLRPTFDTLEDFGNKVLVSKNERKGILDYDGNQIFRIGFKEIEISGEYTIIKY